MIVTQLFRRKCSSLSSQTKWPPYSTRFNLVPRMNLTCQKQDEFLILYVSGTKVHAVRKKKKKRKERKREFEVNRGARIGTEGAEEGHRKVIICLSRGKHSSHTGDASHHWTGVVIHNDGTFEEGRCLRSSGKDR